MGVNRVLKEGMVTKQGGRIKTWKKRWCVLTESGLMYYKDQQSETMQYNNLQGHIELHSIEGVEAVTEKEKVKKKCCFKVITPVRTFFISAPNQEDMESWISIIKTLKEEAGKKGSSEEIDSTKSLEELEQLIGGMDEQIKAEILKLIESFLKEKDIICDELMEREIQEVQNKYKFERQEIQQELKRREN